MADKPVSISIGFTGTDLQRINMVDDIIDEEKPGWFVELANRITPTCGFKATFHQKPWARSLKEVAIGQLWATTNSSYKLERTEFGQYPMKNGKTDTDRAFSYYKYVAFVRKGENPDILEHGIVSGKTYIVERKASIIPTLLERGALVHEAVTYDQMLELLVKGRGDAMAIIDNSFKDAIQRKPEYEEKVEIANVPLVEKAGYIMFSKKLYQTHAPLIECFWTESAQQRKSDWFKTMRQSYVDQ